MPLSLISLLKFVVAIFQLDANLHSLMLDMDAFPANSKKKKGREIKPASIFVESYNSRHSLLFKHLTSIFWDKNTENYLMIAIYSLLTVFQL